MAGIDKVYGTYIQWVELHNWVANSKRPQYCKYFYTTPPYSSDGSITGCIMNTPVHVDVWLWENCPFDWLKERLQEMYQGPPKKPQTPKLG
jgi:hypothetical protein